MIMRINYPRLWLASLGLVASMLLSACGNPNVNISTTNNPTASPSKWQSNIPVTSSKLLVNPDATQISLYDYNGNLISKGKFTNTCNVAQYVNYQTTGSTGPFDNTSCNASMTFSGLTFSQTLNKKYEPTGIDVYGPFTDGVISYTLDPQVLQDFQSSTGVQLGRIKFDVFAADNSQADSKTILMIYNGLFIDLGQTSTYRNKTGDGGIYVVYQINPEGANYTREWTLSTGGQVVSQGSTKCAFFDAITKTCSNDTNICLSWDPITKTCTKTTTGYGFTLPAPSAGTYILAITAKSSTSLVPPFSTSATINVH